MKGIIRIFLLVLNIIFLILLFINGLLGIVEEIFGPPIIEKVLEWLNIPWSYEKFFDVSYICLAVLIITYFLRKKLFST